MTLQCFPSFLPSSMGDWHLFRRRNDTLFQLQGCTSGKTPPDHWEFRRYFFFNLKKKKRVAQTQPCDTSETTGMHLRIRRSKLTRFNHDSPFKAVRGFFFFLYIPIKCAAPMTRDPRRATTTHTHTKKIKSQSTTCGRLLFTQLMEKNQFWSLSRGETRGVCTKQTSNKKKKQKKNKKNEAKSRSKGLARFARRDWCAPRALPFPRLHSGC